MIENWISSYNPRSIEESEQALREIMQEITLAGLYRANFFSHAAFYGGTALRIFHKLDRFSEDLDFSLLHKNPDFDFEPYFNSIIQEFKAVGLNVILTQKLKGSGSKIDSAFLKSDTSWSEIVLDNSTLPFNFNRKPNIKIKLEIDTIPPLGFNTENLLLLKPFSFYVNCFVPSDLFAGKMHALLFRNWKNRVKGRDWYDLEWYIKNGVALNLAHFGIRAFESGHIDSPRLLRNDLLDILFRKIEEVEVGSIKEDVFRFISDSRALDIWSKIYFRELASKMITID
jgi:hypothetical protein